MSTYFSLMTDVDNDGFAIDDVGGGVIVNDINGGIVVDFCCVCTRSLVPMMSSIECSVCDAYRPKSEKSNVEK